MKKLILIFFSFLSSIDLIGQIKISGRVIDSHSKNGVSYASLRFIPLNSGCYTDSLGYFTFDLVQSNDSDSLEISCIGYSSKKVKLLRQELLEIELNLENISLATVFVKANKDNKEEISFPVKKADYFFKASKPIEIITEIKVPNWKSNKHVFKCFRAGQFGPFLSILLCLLFLTQTQDKPNVDTFIFIMETIMCLCKE